MWFLHRLVLEVCTPGWSFSGFAVRSESGGTCNCWWSHPSAGQGRRSICSALRLCRTTLHPNKENTRMDLYGCCVPSETFPWPTVSSWILPCPPLRMPKNKPHKDCPTCSTVKPNTEAGPFRSAKELHIGVDGVTLLRVMVSRSPVSQILVCYRAIHLTVLDWKVQRDKEEAAGWAFFPPDVVLNKSAQVGWHKDSPA